MHESYRPPMLEREKEEKDNGRVYKDVSARMCVCTSENGSTVWCDVQCMAGQVGYYQSQ